MWLRAQRGAAGSAVANCTACAAANAESKHANHIVTNATDTSIHRIFTAVNNHEHGLEHEVVHKGHMSLSINIIGTIQVAL